MMALHFALFESAIGACGIVWNERGIAGVQLPEKDAASTRARGKRRYPAGIQTTPTPDIQAAIHVIVALVRGEKRDLTAFTIDDSTLPEFNRRVYAVVRQVPP